MAGKSCLLFLTLVVMSFCVSAHRPLMVNKMEVVAPSSPTKIEANNENIDHVGTGEMTSVGHNDELSGAVYPDPGPGMGRGSGFQFQLGPIGFGATWDFGLPFPVYGPPFVVVPPYARPYSQPGSYMAPYQRQVQGGPGPQPRPVYGSSSYMPYGFGSVPSFQGLNSPGTQN